MVARGEVWWYEHPEARRRPYLILTRTEAVPVLNQVLGVPATTVIRGIPTEVVLDAADGMLTECALALDNLAPIRKALCTELICRLGPQRMAEVCEALRHATAC